MHSFYKNSFHIGDLELPNNIFYAPLAGCSDYPFRLMSSHYGPGLMFCEMVKMEPLIRRLPETLRMLEYTQEMHPIGGQICGSKPSLAGSAAKMIEDLGFDVVDLNCGCPVDKVTKDGSGSGMLKTPDLIGEILHEMVSTVKIPVTVKIRAGWDETSINAEQITKIAEQAGAKAITIHGRTREQGYTGPANWDHIKRCKEAATTIKVIGNGDVFDAHAARRMFEYTGCDAVLVSRGTFGQPWIVEDIRNLLQGKELGVRTSQAAKELLIQHMSYIEGYKEEREAICDMRRICAWYLKNVAHVREFRAKTGKAASLQEIRDLIHEFELIPA